MRSKEGLDVKIDQALVERMSLMQAAAGYKTVAANGYERIVNAPYLGAPIASAFEQFLIFDDPVVEISRLGTHKVHHACWGIDAIRDSLECIEQLLDLTREGAIAIRHMAGGRC